MRKVVTLFVAIALFSILFSVFYSFAEERITLTTYYPAPYGVYKDMRTNTLAVGKGYRGTTSLTDGQLIVQDRVAINTSSTLHPNDRLTIKNGDISVHGSGARKLNIVSSNSHAGIEIVASPGSTPYIDFTKGTLGAPDRIARIWAPSNDLLNITGRSGQPGNLEIGRRLQIGSGGTPHGYDNIFIRNDTPTIQFEDTNGYDYWIHVNGDRMYFLLDDVGTSAWDRPHPLYFAGRNAYFGANVEVAGPLRARSAARVDGVLEAKSALVVSGDLAALGNKRATCAWTAEYWCDDDNNFNYVTCPAQKYVAGFAAKDFDSGGHCKFKLYCCDL